MEQPEQLKFGAVIDNIRSLAESVKGIKPEHYADPHADPQKELQEGLSADELYALEELATITKRSASKT